ncbi:MAG: sulfatase-like hydrolase/transferase [Chloroflexota bacterium]
MNPMNLLYIISDQHSYDAMGCYGSATVQTPNLDRLAERGTRFTNAYTNCPICVPVRAALATGRYVHQDGFWDNGHPYDGSIPSWHHYLRDQGVQVDSIGKLHFRSTDDDLGFTQSVEPLNVVAGVGDILGCIRDNPPLRQKKDGILESGPGDSTYLQYDIRNAENGCRWLAQHANDEQPWVLFLSFVCPHPPYIAPPALYDAYPLDGIEMMPQWQQTEWPEHSAMAYFRHFFGLEEQFTEHEIRRMNAAYYGATTHLDQQIGRVLNQLDELGLTDKTRTIYTSDHGESRGARGLFGKFTMYEESVGIPFIMAGPDVPEGKVCNTPVSLIDSYPTIVDAVDMPVPEANLDGESLWSIAAGPDQERLAFSEYHAVGSQHASFMVTDGHHKYIHYVNSVPQLFDLHTDPKELNDLSQSQPEVAASFEQKLRTILDPDAVDAQAKADQRSKVDAFGGEEAVRSRGYFVNSPTPDEKPAFHQ